MTQKRENMEPQFKNVNQNVVEAIKTIMNELNGGNRQNIARDIFEVIRFEHRTLQQNFWSVMLLAQIDYASMASDLRNEDSVKLAKLVKKIAIENNWDGNGLNYV